MSTPHLPAPGGGQAVQCAARMPPIRHSEHSLQAVLVHMILAGDYAVDMPLFEIFEIIITLTLTPQNGARRVSDIPGAWRPRLSG